MEWSGVVEWGLYCIIQKNFKTNQPYVTGQCNEFTLKKNNKQTKKPNKNKIDRLTLKCHPGISAQL